MQGEFREGFQRWLLLNRNERFRTPTHPKQFFTGLRRITAGINNLGFVVAVVVVFSAHPGLGGRGGAIVWCGVVVYGDL